MAALLCEDETEKYLRPQHLKKLGDDSLPQEGYIEFNTGARSASRRISMHSLSSDRSNTVNRTSFARESMIEDILVPTKSTHLAVTREENECFRHYSWTPDTMDHAQSTMSSPIHSGFLVSFMVDARGGSMRGSRHNGMRIIIPPRNCPAPTRVTCRLLKRQCLPYPPPLVEGEGFVSRLVEVGPAGVHFLGPVIVEIPHFGSMRGKERELIVLRNDNGNTWKEHHYECRTEDLIALLNGMDEELDSPVELEKKHICRIITKDFPQYFAVVSRIKQENDYMGPEGGILTSESVPMVRAVFPPGALTKKIRVGLQAQPVPEEIVCSVIDNRASFSPIVTVEPRRRKFHKPIIMTIPVPPSTKEVTAKGRKGEPVPCLRLLCSITGGTSPAQWEDITGTTPLSFVTDCVSFTTNVSARFWLADCQQVSDTVALATLIYKELICVPYLAKFVVFAKPIDVAEAQLRCFCMTDDKVDKTLEQQEDFEEVARSKDTEISEGKPIYVHCYGNLSPASKISQQLFFTFDAFKENRLPFIVKVWDIGQEPCGRLAFLKELKTTKGLAQSTICNLNFTLPAQKKEMETEPDNENDKDQRHIIASLALRQRFSCLSDPTSKKTKRGNTALKTTSQTSGYSYKPAFMTHQYQAWVTSPVASASGQAKSGFVSLSSSSSNTLSATPLRSGLSGNSDSPITSVIRGSFTPSIKSVSDVALPIRSHRAVSSSQKIVEQQAQNPVQASLTPLSSPVKNIPDSVSVKALPSLSARTSLLPAGGSLLEKPFITRTPPASPTSSPKSSNSSNFSYKSANISNVLTTASPIKTFSGLTTVKTTTNTSSSHSSPTKYHSPSPIFLLSGSLQERIQATTFAATTSVNAAFDEVERTLNSCSASYEKLKAVPSSPPSTYQSILSSGSVYDSLSPPPNSTTSVTYSTVAVPVYSVINVLPERQFKKLPNISKSTATLLSPRKAMAPEANAQIQSTSARILSPGKTFPFMSPATSSSPLSNSQDILKDVHEMKEDLIRMSAILQTDTCAKGFQSNSNKEHKIEDEEAYKIMEKVKQDLVKVSEILTNDILKEGKKYKKGSKAEDLEHDIDNNQQNGWRCPPRYETVAPQVKKRVMTDRDFNLAKVLDYLTYDTGTHSLSKTEAAPQRNEESRRERKEKVKRVLKPAMAVQESKLKMPPLIMHPSPSEKALSKLADALFGTEAVLDSDDVSHDQDKSPLSDSGFETRSEKTPSAPQSADSMGPTAPFQEISPVITETRTETVHVIRCYRPPEVTNEPVVDEVKMANSLAQCTDTEFRLPTGYHKDRVKTYQASSSPVEDIMCKGMRLKEEAHITTTTRMLYHKPASKETTSERFEETVMNSLQSGRDPSRELTGLFEHQGSNEGWKEPQRPLNKDSKPKVEHIIEVHIEKGNKTEPTEVIIMETKNHPEKEMYIYQSSIRKNELQNREEVEKVIPPFLQEDDVRTTTVQLMTKDLCKTLKLQRPHSVEYPEEDSSIMRRESNKITDKMLFTEKFNSSYSDSDESLTERSHYYEMRTHGGSVRYIMLKPDKTGGVLDDNENCDNLALLQYASDPASQKKSIWTRVSEDRQGGSTEKCKFEDRVDKTVKEAEEKLSEVSWFFRDKTKKLKDELQSPEKKNHRPNSQEAQSVPSSTCSSPERTVLKNGGSGEQWSRESEQIEYTERVTPSVTANIKPLPVYVSIPVGKQYGKETATGQPSTYKKVVSHESQTMHEAREVFYTVKQRQQPSPQWNPEDDTLENVTSSGRSPITPETPSSEEVSYDLNSRAPDTVIVSVAGEPSPIPEESEEEEQPKTFIFREVPAENPKAVKIPPEFSKGNHELPGKRVKGKQVAYFEFPPFPPQDTQLSDQMELKKDSPPSEADTEMMEVNLQEEHDRHLFAEPVIQIHPPSPLPPGADNNDSSDDESVIQPIPLKKYNFKMTQNGKKCVKPRNPDRNGSHHKESQSINGVIKGDEEDEQNGNDQSVTDCSIATTAEFSHDTDATEIDSLDGYDLQDEDDGLSDTKTSSLSNDVKTGNCSFSLTKLEVRKESTPNKESGENTKSKSNLYKKTESGKDQCKIYSLEGRHPDRQEFADNYFSYKLEEELHSTFKTVATKGLDFDPWSNKGGEEEVFEAKSKDEDPKYFGLLVEEKSQATTPDTTPARTPTDDSTPSSEPNPFPFHEGKMFEMTRSGAIDMSKRDFVEERLQFFQIGEHTAKGKTGDKGKRGKCVVVSASQSKAGGRSVEGMVEATTNITPSRNCPTQGITCCLDAPSCTDIVGETTSCTVTASKVNPKFHIPIKMGIAASITIKKDSADWTDFRAESSASQMLEHDNLETHVNYCQFGSTCSDSPSDRKDCPSENSSNNNNLEACSVQANYIHGGSIVFNLQSSSEPTLQKASRVEAHFCRTSLVLVKDKSNAQTLQWKTDSQKGLEIKCQPKSRLPVKIAGFSFNTHNSGKQISQQIVKPETRKCDSISIKPRSRIPVKDIKRNSAVSSAVGPKLGKLLEGERVVRKVASSQLPTRDRSSWTIKNCSVEADRTNISGLCRKSIKFLQNISVEAAKVTEHLSDKEKQTQAEQLEKDSSTSRCTSLSDPSQSQPSLSDGSSRGGAPIRSKVTRSAGSERRRSRRTGGGKEGNRGTGVCGLPYIAEIKPSPQSPCERTDLRMAIVADHLGLSWTELAREMNFSVDEINHIRKENPNSLTAQSFMLLKQWVSRDGKNATTDALTAVLTKVNRMDIVTLLEGPIFDYGNISGTRSFADDSAVEKSYGKV
ncbi:hypothetical protein PHYPO_G00018740 [Pangasianodon hypophthalmus]|uniref:ZU5 domain-containing protein n=1 Tax=Pangasianodon hypophthalmus TaxID=310915 RepID=A0A5N5N6U2_PANHP|nr:hypothetical protein PHYPO_G00018740 [Pangasianodon hypophthalmus]